MTTLFISCVAIGGTILAVQFVLMMVGFLDLGVDVVDDFGADSVDGIDSIDGVDHVDGVDHTGEHGPAHVSQGFAWIWSVLSFRNLTTGVTFFGLIGMTAHSMGVSPSLQLSSAATAGLAAMYGMHWLMRSIFRLARDSTMQVQRAIGETGTVYLSVPAAKTGRGKVHVKVQGRLEEFAAITAVPDKLPVGAKVVVVDVVDGETLAVLPVDIDAELSRKIASAV